MDKILVVDDDLLFLDALKLGLRKYASQFESFFALSVDEAIEVLKNNHIAVLVTDLMMPDKDGLDLFAYIDQFYPRIQKIIMTGHGTEELKDTARTDGAFCYLEKPFELSELGRSIMRAMESRDEGSLIKSILMSTLLKLVQMKKKTCILEVDHATREQGVLYFINGVLFDAKYNDIEKKEAALKILSWKRVNFRFKILPQEMLKNRIENLISYLIQDEAHAQNEIAEKDDQSETGSEKKLRKAEFDSLVEETLNVILEESLEAEGEETLDDHLDELFSNSNDNEVEEEAGEEIVDQITEDDTSSKHEPIHLLIVDDSKIMRKVIKDIFFGDSGIQIVGECENGRDALEMVQQLNVDVMTLDVEMPVMDGLTTLKHLMIKHPVPAVMVSSLTQEGASATFDALKLGAVDFVAKPSRLSGIDMAKQSSEIIRKVKLAADVEIRSVQFIRSNKNVTRKNQLHSSSLIKCKNLVAIGAAEGGYGALLKIVPRLPDQFPGACLVVLHAETTQVDAFVKYLDGYSNIKVKRARNGEPLHGGCCYFASGEEYLTIQSLNNNLFLQVTPAPQFRNRSHINIMMFSAAEMLHEHTTGVILSGSGMDGCEGMAEIGRVGGTTFVQDPRSCIHKQMAETVLNRFGADKVIPDNEIALALIHSIN